MRKTLTILGGSIARLERAAIALLLAALAVVTLIQVLTRNLGIYVSWVEDVAVLLLVWQVFLGSALALRYGGHYTVDLFGKLPPGFDWLLRGLAIAVTAVVLAVLFWKGAELAWMLRFRLSGAGEIPMYAYYAAFPTASVFGALHLAEATFGGPRLPAFGMVE